MSTRDEILKALAEHPDGLTSKELAPLCPACECDPMIVARTVAAIAADQEIHSAGLRDGGVIWQAGAPKVETVESKLSLAGMHNQVQGRSAADHAQAIVAMREKKVVPAAKPVLPTVQQPVPQKPAAPLPTKEVTMKRNDKSITERVLDALKGGTPMSLDDLAKTVGTTKQTLYTYLGTLQKKHGVKRVRPGIYQLSGKPAKADEPRAPQERKARVERVNPPAAKNGDAQFTLDESGAIGISKDGQDMDLDSHEIERLRSFIEKTQDLRSA